VDGWGHTTIEHLHAIVRSRAPPARGKPARQHLTAGSAVWVTVSPTICAATGGGERAIDPNDIPPWQDDGLDPSDAALISQDMSSIQEHHVELRRLIRTTPRCTVR